jgi:hypothetical protein
MLEIVGFSPLSIFSNGVIYGLVKIFSFWFLIKFTISFSDFWVMVPPYPLDLLFHKVKMLHSLHIGQLEYHSSLDTVSSILPDLVQTFWFTNGDFVVSVLHPALVS